MYKDLWLPSEQRANMVDVGIMNENTRKLMSKDDSADKTADTKKFLLKVFADRVRVKLGKILNDHGLYAPYGMNSNFQYRIILPKASDIMVAQSSQEVAGHALEDIKLEYVTIEDSTMYNQALNSYQIGRSLIFDYITMMDTEVWRKDTTLINKTINVPCQVYIRKYEIHSDVIQEKNAYGQ